MISCEQQVGEARMAALMQGEDEETILRDRGLSDLPYEEEEQTTE